MPEKKNVYLSYAPSFLPLMILLQIILVVLKCAGILASAPWWAVLLPLLCVVGGVLVTIAAVALLAGLCFLVAWIIGMSEAQRGK